MIKDLRQDLVKQEQVISKSRDQQSVKVTKAMRAANRMHGGCNVSSGDEVDVGEETRDHDLDEYTEDPPS